MEKFQIMGKKLEHHGHILDFYTYELKVPNGNTAYWDVLEHKIPGDTKETTIAGIIADEMAIGMVNQKTTAVRLIPVQGKDVGDQAEFGGLLGYAPIMPVNPFGCDDFVTRTGRIPAPIHSFKN